MEQAQQRDPKEAIREFTDELIRNTGYEAFERLDAEKRNRIINVCLSEFLNAGYQGTSTNELVKKAGISKGLLFHYFGSKAGLFKYLLNEASARLTGDVIDTLDLPVGDVLATIGAITLKKIEISLQFPLETSFIIYALKDTLPAELVAYRERFLGYANNYVEVVSALIDERLLKPSVSKLQAAEVVAWVCQGYADKLIAEGALTTNEDALIAIAQDMDRYFEVLRQGMYQ